MVSACSKPGSRRCTCMSMKPGATIMPVASKTSALGVDRLGATPAIRPSTISTSATRSVWVAGSITRPFLMTIDIGLSNDLLEHRHAYRDAVFHLVEDHGALEIGHFGGQFPASVDRAGVHYDGVGLGQVEVLQAKAVKAEVLTRREGGFMLPFQLDAKHHDDVGVTNSFADIRSEMHSGCELREFLGKQRGRTTEHDL